MAKSSKKSSSVKVVRKRNPLPITLKKKPKSKKSDHDLVNAYVESVSSIGDLTQIFASMPEGMRRGIGGKRKLTTKEQMILKIIQKEQSRADRLLNLIRQNL